MKSILIEKPNQLSIIEREIPTPSAGEVRVKVKLAGICGSDSHIYRGHNPFAKGNDSNLLIVFYVQIMPDDFVMQLHR
ncbi:alcohol dehydrogenase catalytic domain-containing protein, partial [Escherichia coli]